MSSDGWRWSQECSITFWSYSTSLLKYCSSLVTTSLSSTTTSSSSTFWNINFICCQKTKNKKWTTRMSPAEAMKAFLLECSGDCCWPTWQHSVRRLGDVPETRITRSERDVVVGGRRMPRLWRLEGWQWLQCLHQKCSSSARNGDVDSKSSIISHSGAVFGTGGTQSSSSYTSTWETPTPVHQTPGQAAARGRKSSLKKGQGGIE